MIGGEQRIPNLAKPLGGSFSFTVLGSLANAKLLAA